ncbi:MAG: AAA family ATPase [Pusillimonas sp.]
MKLFFGKISTKKEKDQITQGYYRAPKDSSWFNGIQPGDYCFTIGNGKIQLWKAKSWGKKSGDDVLEFDIIHNDLGINTKQLTAIKYFNLTMELVVLTVRSTAKSKKAFFPIEFSRDFTEVVLKDINTYKNADTFRRIHILSEGQTAQNNSTDLQLFKKDGEWSLHAANFISRDILDAFKDNTGMLGSGQINKDKTITTILDSGNSGKKLSTDELSILQMYDLFCCNYKNKETVTVEDSIRQDEIADEGELDQALAAGECNIILYGPPGTGKTYEVLSLIEDLDTNAKVGVQIEHKGTLNLNRTFWHLAPGRNGYLWEELKKGNRLGYEWCGKELGDLTELASTVDSHQIRRRFSQVRQGDYFCIIRGRQCLGIAEALEDYNFEKAEKGPFEFQTVEVKWLAQFDTPILLNTSSTKTFSGVGGQRWDDLIAGLKEKGFTFGEEDKEKTIFKKLYKFTTFHQSYSYEDFIEGIKPRLSEDKNEDETEQIAEIEYEIKPGIFYNACDKAAQLAEYSDLQEALQDTKEGRADKFSKAQPYYLIIDEINRGNVANIFGELITLIEKDKRLGAQKETIVNLPYSKDDFGVPANLILIGTMNTADRSIEALDSALRRRFTFIEYAPEPELLTKPTYASEHIDLQALLTAINNRIELLLDKDHIIGHSYFMGIKSIEDLMMSFKNKVIPLLEEYFYGKPQMIGLVLGPAFLKEKEMVQLFSNFDTDFSDIQEKKRFKINIPDSWDEYKAIYGHD